MLVFLIMPALFQHQNQTLLENHMDVKTLNKKKKKKNSEQECGL
jgi:hypothetical protein